MSIFCTVSPLAFSCPNLSAPENGAITYSENAVGFVRRADYACNSGFQMSDGDTVRTCVSASGSSGEWTGTAPTCEGKNYSLKP